MDSLTIAISGSALDGFIVEANGSPAARGKTFQEYMTEKIASMGQAAAERRGIGIIPSSDFVLRFTSAENAAITTLAESDAPTAQLLNRIRGAAMTHLYSQEVINGLQYIASKGAIAANRIPVLLAYDRPVFQSPS